MGGGGHGAAPAGVEAGVDGPGAAQHGPAAAAAVGPAEGAPVAAAVVGLLLGLAVGGAAAAGHRAGALGVA